jgi:hypothetical protein
MQKERLNRGSHTVASSVANLIYKPLVLEPGVLILVGSFQYALLAALGKEREIRNIDQEMVNNRGTDDSNDTDYGDISGAAASEIEGRPRSQKQVRQANDTKYNDVKTPFTHSFNVLYYATAATLSGSIQESEEIPIHRYLTIKTIESKVMNCHIFSRIITRT